MLKVFCAPSRYTQGKNATAALGQEMATLGLAGPALVVAGPRVIQLLAETGALARRSGHSPCCASFRRRVFAGGDRTNPSGGSPERGPRHRRRWRRQGARRGPSGSRRSRSADCKLPHCGIDRRANQRPSVIYSAEGTFEQYRFYRRNPDLVLVDTQVIAQSPPRLFVAGMGDAMSTYFEARTSVAAHRKNMRGGASTLSALALAELCQRTVLADGVEALHAVKTQVVTPALERVVEANTLLSGLGFESSGLAAAHAVHNGLTAAHATHDYLHGEKVAFGVLVQLILEGSQQLELNQVLEFFTCVGLPTTLAQIGLADASRATIESIANRATAEGETIHNEPFAVRPDMVVDAILAADALGRSGIATS